MKLVLYSGGQSRSNHTLHQTVVNLAREDKPHTKTLQMTYIPFCSDDSSIFFKRAAKRYSAYGVKKFLCLNVDAPISKYDLQQTMKSDIIYLAGGNTFYFLKHLQQSGMLERLKTFVNHGGVLAGLSAGGLIMSPTIKLAAYGPLGPDENDVKLKNLKGMNLFQFEFSPHFDFKPKEIKAHIQYSRTTKYPVYAVKDGSGIVVNGSQFSIHGKASLFYRGTQLLLK